MSVAEAARRHGVTATTISNWRDRFIEAGKGGLENKISGPAHGGTVAERRLRSENEQLKLALAEQMVQLRLWQKGAEHIGEVPSPTGPAQRWELRSRCLRGCRSAQGARRRSTRWPLHLTQR